MSLSRRFGRILLSGMFLGMFLLAACQDLTPPLPAGVPDPETLRTPEGAVSLYKGTLLKAIGTTVSFILASGELTDELQSTSIGNPENAGIIPRIIDARNTTPNQTGVIVAYRGNHAIRNNAMQAIAALRVYAPGAPPALRGELYAWQGYAEMMLAELFCSGIPLSTVDFEGDYTYHAGSTRDQVFTHAIALFDSALAISGDSARIMHFARVGKGRALVNLGQFAAAATVVALVPDGYTYQMTLPMQVTETFIQNQFNGVTVANNEGGNGLAFRTSHDLRSAVRSNNGKLPFVNDSVWVPLKYDSVGPALQFVIASAIEARLIEAEAALQDQRFADWANILSTLRASAITPSIAPLPSDSVTQETGVAANTMRATVMFQERAFWLFLTGHRQGDLRRLMRQYGRGAEQVYPTGFMDPSGFSRYGTEVTFPVPLDEQQLNPLYTGCVNQGA